MTKTRKFLKLILLVIFSLMLSPLIAIAKIEQWISTSENWFCGIGELLSLIPGKSGSSIRLAYYHATIEQCGLDVDFRIGTKINHRTACIGRGVIFGAQCNIGTVTIGDYCLIGSRVCIPSGGRQHDFIDMTKNITEYPTLLQRVHIGANTWIGEGAIVLADVGTRCVVGAGSVVFRPVPEGYNAMGNPARIISRDFSTPANLKKTNPETATN